MKKLLLVIDVQNDFINDNIKDYVAKIEELIVSNKYDEIVFTKFINNENSKWYKELNYKGCIDKQGQAIVIDTQEHKIFEKTIYSALNNELRKFIKEK